MIFRADGWESDLDDLASLLHEFTGPFLSDATGLLGELADLVRGHIDPDERGGRWYVADMSTPADVTRKVRQLDNDVQSIYEMLARIEATQSRQGNRLDELQTGVVEMDGKLNRIIELLEQR